MRKWNFFNYELSDRVRNESLTDDDVELIWTAWCELNQKTSEMEFDPFLSNSEHGHFHDIFAAFEWFTNHMLNCKFGYVKMEELSSVSRSSLAELWKNPYTKKALVITRGLLNVFEVSEAPYNSLNSITVSKKNLG